MHIRHGRLPLVVVIPCVGWPLIAPRSFLGGSSMNNIIYIVGLVVIVLLVLGWLGLR